MILKHLALFTTSNSLKSLPTALIDRLKPRPPISFVVLSVMSVLLL